MTSQIQKTIFHLPTKPFSIIDAINRVYCATGNMRMAMAADSSDFNGHRTTLAWNDYRGYYTVEYYWGQRVVLARTADIKQAVSRAIEEYDRQGKGAMLIVIPRDEDADYCQSHERLVEGEHDRTISDWWTWQHKHAGEFVRWDKQFGGMDAKKYMEAESWDSYLDQWRADRGR